MASAGSLLALPSAALHRILVHLQTGGDGGGAERNGGRNSSGGGGVGRTAPTTTTIDDNDSDDDDNFSADRSSGDDAANAAAARLVCKQLADVFAGAALHAAPKSLAALALAAERFPNLQDVNLSYLDLARTRCCDDVTIATTNAAAAAATAADAMRAAQALGRLRNLRRLALGDGPAWDAARQHVLAALRGCGRLEQLRVAGAGDDVAAAVAGLTQLRAVALSGRVSDAGLQALLGALTRLSALSLSCCDAISDAGLGALAGLPRLVSLQLHSCLQLGDESLRAIGGLTALTALCLSHSCEDASARGLLALSRLSRLRHLNLGAATQLAAPGALAALLRALPTLEYVDVSYVECTTPEVLRALGRHGGGLRSLGLCGLPAAALPSLRELRRLSRLEALTMRWSGQLRNQHVASFLPHLVRLTALDLAYCLRLTGEGLSHLAWLTGLRALNLAAIGHEHLSAALPALRQLTGLTVSSLPATGDAWRHIASLRGLRALALRRCQLTAATVDSGDARRPAAKPSVAALAALTALTALDCSNATLAPCGAAALCAPPRLAHLCLNRARGVDDDALAALGTGARRLAKVDLRIRGAGSTWTRRGLLALLAAAPQLGAVYVSEPLPPPALPAREASRVLVCEADAALLPVARDVGGGPALGAAAMF